MYQILFERMNEFARMPVKAVAAGDSEFANACFDLFLPSNSSDLFLEPHVKLKVGLRFKTSFSDELGAFLRDKSGVGSKGAIKLAGMIDSSYRGEWFVSLINVTKDVIFLPADKSIVQVVFLPIPRVSFTEVVSVPISGRGEGGYGSTGQ